jgi:murein DD-endopeptidase MepM/ murein hydrolase activator NlpD
MSIWPHRADSRTPSRGRGVARGVALTVALTLAVVGTVVSTDTQKAFAVDYPSWNDVIAARGSEIATLKEISRIQALIESLRAEVERTQADAIAKGELAQEADQRFQEAALKAQELQSQADAKEALATQSKQQAGEIVAQQYRSGNGDVSTNLLVNAAKADDILYTFGMADKFTEQTAAIYEKALQDQNTAQALTDQADKAQGLLEQLKIEAEAAAETAQAAADAAAAAVAEQEANQDTLSSQLTVLQERRAVTEADYMTGVAVRAEAARVKAIADAAAAAAAGAGVVGQSGWAKPTYGGITSGYGMRMNPVSHKWILHAGTDMSSGCGKPIYAAHAGVVGMAAPNGSYGNFIRIDNGDNISTAYGHIVNGGTLVGRGQSVSSGQLIAYVGTTGGSTGCHLHFEVRINGVATDAVPFMRNQGVTLG